MTNRTSWTAGLGQGLTYGSLFNSSDLQSLANGSSVLSTIADITNGTLLDQFMSISYLLAIASSTIAAGANFTFWLYDLNQDGTHYGDNQLPTPGTAVAITPSFTAAAYAPIPTVAATTNMYATMNGIVLPPGSFRMAMQNNCGFALTAGTQTVKYRTYNQNLDA